MTSQVFLQTSCWETPDLLIHHEFNVRDDFLSSRHHPSVVIHSPYSSLAPYQLKYEAVVGSWGGGIQTTNHTHTRSSADCDKTNHALPRIHLERRQDRCQVTSPLPLFISRMLLSLCLRSALCTVQCGICIDMRFSLLWQRKCSIWTSNCSLAWIFFISIFLHRRFIVEFILWQFIHSKKSLWKYYGSILFIVCVVCRVGCWFDAAPWTAFKSLSSFGHFRIWIRYNVWSYLASCSSNDWFCLIVPCFGLIWFFEKCPLNIK